MGLISTWIEKGRKIKSRGIALTHKDQGYSANNRPVSLLTKSNVDPKTLTVDIVKALEQVQLNISMEEFLRRFFYMYSSDAELLTKALGFKTEFEQNIEDNPPDEDDTWEKDWQKRHQEYIEERLQSINIIKKARESGEDSLTLVERFELVETRKAFEEGCAELSLDFSETPSATQSAPGTLETPKPSGLDVIVKATGASTESSAGATTNTNEEIPVEKEVDVTKSAAFIEMQKANEALMAQMQSMSGQLKAAEEIVKAAEASRKSVAIEKAAAMPFVAETQREAIATVILNPEMATVVSVLEKAVASLAEKDAALTAKDAEIEEVKKSFADGKQIGADGELTQSAKGAEDAQAALDRIIKARSAQLSPTA